MRIFTDKKGLTFLELVVIVAIIASLTALVIPSVSRLLKEALEAETKSELQGINVAVTNYYYEKNKYPDSWNDLKGYMGSIDKLSEKYEFNSNVN